MRYKEFIFVEGYKEVQQKFSQEADPTQVATVVASYKKLVDANRITGNERNIDWWGKQGWAKFAEYVTATEQLPSQTVQKKRKDTGDAHVIEETDKWLIVVPLDKDASCFHGKDTHWCTTKPFKNDFEKYFYDRSITLLYFIRKADTQKWAIAVSTTSETVEHFDANDKSLPAEEFDTQTGLSSANYIKMARGTEVNDKAGSSRTTYKELLTKALRLTNKLKNSTSPERNKSIEVLLVKTKHQKSINNYVNVLYDGNNKQLVQFDNKVQTLFATDETVGLLKNITLKTLKQVSKNYDIDETHSLLKGLDLEPGIESKIVNDPKLATAYAIAVLGKRWPEAEAAIAKSHDASYYYASRAKSQGWLDGLRADPIWKKVEASIATDAWAAYSYAREVLDGRWKPGEAAIASDASAATLYAIHVLKGRYKAAEAAIAKAPEYLEHYNNYLRSIGEKEI